MTKLFEYVISNYGTISLIVVTTIGLLAKFRKKIRNAIRSINLSNSFYGKSDSPAEEIFRLFEDIRRLEIRAQLVERELEIGIFIAGVDGQWEFSNERLGKLLGDSRDLVGLGWLSSVVLGQRDRVLRNWKKSIANQTPYEDSYTIENDRDGTTFQVTAKAVAASRNGVVECYVGYLTIEED